VRGLEIRLKDGSFFKYDKTFASDLYLIYKLRSDIRLRSAAHVLSSTYILITSDNNMITTIPRSLRNTILTKHIF
jgi:hypothetical protein